MGFTAFDKGKGGRPLGAGFPLKKADDTVSGIQRGGARFILGSAKNDRNGPQPTNSAAMSHRDRVPAERRVLAEMVVTANSASPFISRDMT